MSAKATAPAREQGLRIAAVNARRTRDRRIMPVGDNTQTSAVAAAVAACAHTAVAVAASQVAAVVVAAVAVVAAVVAVGGGAPISD
jgi:hypothetical protein